MDTNLANQILTIVAVALFGWDMWQLASARKNKDLQLKEKQLHKAQVKIWQHFANGINHNLLMISEAIRTGKLKDLKAEEFEEIIRGVQASANALYTSLNEERLFTDEEIKLRQLENENVFKQLKVVSQSPSKPISKSA